MAADRDLEPLIAGVETVVEEALSYFQGPGATSQVRVGEWGAREVLCHFLFWHEATAQGMESVAGGGEPFQVEATTDEMNARAIADQAGKGLPELIREAQRIEARLVKGARALADLGETVLVRSDGRGLSGRQRLELIADHWREHLSELQA